LAGYAGICFCWSVSGGVACRFVGRNYFVVDPALKLLNSNKLLMPTLSISQTLFEFRNFDDRRLRLFFELLSPFLYRFLFH
jgi:hypothetical protein